MSNARAFIPNRSLPQDLAQTLSEGQELLRCYNLFKRACHSLASVQPKNFRGDRPDIARLQEARHILKKFRARKFKEHRPLLDDGVITEIVAARERYGEPYRAVFESPLPLVEALKPFQSLFSLVEILGETLLMTLNSHYWASEYLLITQFFPTCERQDMASLVDDIINDLPRAALFVGLVASLPRLAIDDSALNVELEREIAAVLRLREEGHSWRAIGPTDDANWSRPYTPAELRKVFGLSWDTVKRRLKSGAIRHVKLSDKSYRIHVHDLPK